MNTGSTDLQQGLDRPSGHFTNSSQFSPQLMKMAETCDLKTALLFTGRPLEIFSGHITELLGKKYPSDAAFAAPISQSEKERLGELIRQMTGTIRAGGVYGTRLSIFLARFTKESLSHLAIAAAACTSSDLLIDEAHRIMREKD